VLAAVVEQVSGEPIDDSNEEVAKDYLDNKLVCGAVAARRRSTSGSIEAR